MLFMRRTFSENTVMNQQKSHTHLSAAAHKNLTLLRVEIYEEVCKENLNASQKSIEEAADKLINFNFPLDLDSTAYQKRGFTIINM